MPTLAWCAIALIVGFIAGAGVAISFRRDRAQSLAQFRAGEAVTLPRKAVKRYEIKHETPGGGVTVLFSGPDPLRARQQWEYAISRLDKGELVFLENGVERSRH